jgi:hypothetical protein
VQGGQAVLLVEIGFQDIAHNGRRKLAMLAMLE